jgi:hypothetical protein
MTIKVKTSIVWDLFGFVVVAIVLWYWGLELSTSHLPGRYSTT